MKNAITACCLVAGCLCNPSSVGLSGSATWPADPAKQLVYGDDGLWIHHPDGWGVVDDEYPDDPWVYDETLAPYGEEVLVVYNRSYGQEREFRVHTKEKGWVKPGYEEYTIDYDDGKVEAPDAWLVIPEPKHLPKLVDGYTKEQLEQKLKEFDK